MSNPQEVKSLLRIVSGKTIAIVYIFEKEDAPGFNHYWIWKSNIITGWMNAVQELNCIPFILDVRTFVQKAIDRTLPQIDFVLNLNCGSFELSSMSLVPSVCSFLSIPCIPCNAIAIVTTENKEISNFIAAGTGLNVPATLSSDLETGIFRPLNLGSSLGVKRGSDDVGKIQGTYQEFIPGYDLTFPIVYNILEHDIDLLPPILFIPATMDPNWIYDKDAKEQDQGFSIYPLLKVDDEIRKAFINFAHVFPIQTYGRIDTRLRWNKSVLSEKIIDSTITLEDLFFVEINSMPTIEKDDSFEYAFEAANANSRHSFFNTTQEYKRNIKMPSINGFLLLSSIAALL